ncbi:hypothetical protein BCR34DRAFT_73328 [Clohesyomyces aquaticus]|uniref:Uncharacterized protein n=1 Tax=Clohesyomyces aquaticus TaxID=1231657 RepID=A0A1Y1YYY6_9PLEO|nr:hypothetical protein BCR34DRAFT_73328 [Clohesyomyces aquaticus]
MLVEQGCESSSINQFLAANGESRQHKRVESEKKSLFPRAPSRVSRLPKPARMNTIDWKPVSLPQNFAEVWLYYIWFLGLASRGRRRCMMVLWCRRQTRKGGMAWMVGLEGEEGVQKRAFLSYSGATRLKEMFACGGAHTVRSRRNCIITCNILPLQGDPTMPRCAAVHQVSYT